LIIYGIGIAILVITELIGIYRKGKGDTITEGWRLIDRELNGWLRWLWRIFTIGFLGWLILHFTTGKV